MTVDEIYAELVQHQIKGLMVHEQLAEYYDFLGLKGYKRCHEYHYFEENCAYRSTVRYFINHHNKLVPERNVENPKVIPESWYRYTRDAVDANTRKQAVKNGLQTWYDWEHETKQLYEKLYNELLEINEVASACKVKELICCVDKEFKKVCRYLLEKQAVDYDMTVIISEQKEMHNKYRGKLKHLGVFIC